MRVSCLCVTEDRPEFIPWLVWNFQKQTWPDKELVVIDSSKESIQDLLPEGTIYKQMDPGVYIPVKRNKALEVCTGEVITWMDDDDWQHPRKCEILAEALEANKEAKLAGSLFKYFLDLETLLTTLTKRKLPIFGSVGVYRETARSYLFPHNVPKASDSYWLSAIMNISKRKFKEIEEELLLIGLCHDENISNPRTAKKCSKSFFELREQISVDDWEKTNKHLTSLRERLSIEGPPIEEVQANSKSIALSLSNPKKLPIEIMEGQKNPVDLSGTIKQMEKQEVHLVEQVSAQTDSDICIVITTYNRPALLFKLLKDIEDNKDKYQIDVRIYDDASSTSYFEVLQFVNSMENVSFFRAQQNHGKRLFHKWITKIYQKLRDSNAKYFISLPDDVRLCKDFFQKAISFWEDIKGKRKICLNLLVDDSRQDQASWTRVQPSLEGNVFNTGWVDGCFLCERSFFEVLNYSVPPVPSSWFKKRIRSSGVGASISKLLHARKYKMYRVKESLVFHVASSSKMNPFARSVQPLLTTSYVDGIEEASKIGRTEMITISLASIPARKEGLKKVVASLKGQADRLNVYLNNYKHVPKFLEESWITIARSQDHGDLGDAGKFWWSGSIKEGYHFTCDDDLIYPPGYCLRLIERIEAYRRKVVVGMHGAILVPHFQSYLKGRKVLHWNQNVVKDQAVHVLGTGCLAYHHSTVKISIKNFQLPNMADIWFAILTKRQQIPLVVCQHEKGIFKLIFYEDNIFDRTKKSGDKKQTELLSAERPWTLIDLKNLIVDNVGSKIAEYNKRKKELRKQQR